MQLFALVRVLGDKKEGRSCEDDEYSEKSAADQA